MPKNFINYFSVVVVLSLSIALSAQELSVVRLTNEQLELGWKKGVGGYTLETLKVKGTNGWEIMEIAKYQHNVLYASSKPETAPQATVTNRMGNMVPSLALLKPVKTGRFMVGCATSRPTTAPAIMQMNMKVVM